MASEGQVQGGDQAELTRLRARVAELEAKLAAAEGGRSATGPTGERIVQLVDSADDAIWCMDPFGRFTFLSQAVRKSLGYEPEALLGKSAELVLTEAAAKAARARLEAYLRGEETAIPVRLELEHRRKDGGSFWGEILVHPVLDERGRLIEIQGVTRDVTERRRMEEALREGEERFRRIFDQAPVGAAIVGLDLRYLQVNGTYCRITGYSAEEMTSLTVRDTTHPDDFGKEERYVRQLIEGESDEFRIEKRYIRKDGATVWGRLSVSLIRDAEGQPTYLLPMVEDVTERKRAEEERARLQAQLVQAQKMESVGRLAGGVAHDFNNMLGVILGHTEIALDQVNPGDALCADLEEIRNAATRSAALTRQLLTFARKQTITLKVLDLNETVEGMLNMLQRLIGENIELAWRPGHDLWPVQVDPSQIDQILANLCVNARDAIADVGRITIETRNAAGDEAHCPNHTDSVPGDYVRLVVTDNGRGMDRETLDHIFEPFFTTKGVGEGTGLGLAMVYGAVRQNNGFITASSREGEGTTFTICLPRHIGKTEQVQTPGVQGMLLSGHETVLLVEDQASILRLTKRMLEMLGYTVLAAPTPGEAMSLAREHPGEIHLLMTDVIMPEMNGRDLARNVLSLYPNIRRLFMSGYTADVIAHHGILEEGVHFIEKPFSRETLIAKLREVFESR